MSDQRVRELWSRFLAGEPLSPEDRTLLLERLRGDANLREDCLRELAFDGLLRGMGWVRADRDGFVELFSRYLANEREAGEFLARMQDRMREEGLVVARSSRRRRRPWFPRRSSLSPKAAWVAGSVAAALFLGFTLLLSLSGPSPAGPGTGKVEGALSEREREEAARKTAEAEESARQEARKRKAEAARNDAEKRLQALRLEAARLEEERRKPAAADEDLKKKAEEVARKRKQAEDLVTKLREEEKRATAETTLRSPPQGMPRTEVTAATVERADGDVYLVADGKRTPAKPGSAIRVGEGIEAEGPSSGAVLVYADKTRLELGPGTVVREVADRAGRDGLGKWVELARGTIRAEVATQAPGRAMAIGTPHGEARVLGTTLRLIVDPDPKKGIRLEVEAGKVRLKYLSGKPVDVPAGHYAVAASGVELVVRPTPPRTITVKFGPADLAVPEGILLDSGAEFDLKRGYGWRGPDADLPGVTLNGGPVKARAPIARPAQDALRGGCLSVGWKNHPVTWSMPIANGRYLVTVCVGDPGGEGGPHHVGAEEIQIFDAVLTRGDELLERKDIPVVVKDGELTVVVGGHRSTRTTAGGRSDTDLQYLIIKEAVRR